ncbi:MAG TPA: hypothetical protein VN783_02410 [Thermoanaerobaculia bacterium]|nr:hypothetical protein [Thermoanaerobaculia bacterium]
MSAERKRGSRRVFPPSPFRETALVRFAAASPVRKLLAYLGRLLCDFAAQVPIEDLGESFERAGVRATGADLRASQDFLTELARRPRAFKLPRADRDLCAWATERAREVALIAVRIERRLGPPAPTSSAASGSPSKQRATKKP